MRPKTATLIAALALLLALPTAQAQWKWRDQNGRITASDRPPPLDIPEKDILGRPAPTEVRRSATAASTAASSAAPTPGPLEREIEARRRATEQEASSKNKAEEERLAAQRAENCRRARGHMAGLESGQRIARLNDKGEREVLDDRGRAQEMRQAREVIASDCK